MTKPTYWEKRDRIDWILNYYVGLDDAAERVADLVARLEPTDANDVYWRACELATSRAWGIEHDNEFVELFDTVLDGLTPWLQEQGFPAPQPLNDNEKRN